MKEKNETLEEILKTSMGSVPAGLSAKRKQSSTPARPRRFAGTFTDEDAGNSLKLMLKLAKVIAAFLHRQNKNPHTTNTAALRSVRIALGILAAGIYHDNLGVIPVECFNGKKRRKPSFSAFRRKLDSAVQGGYAIILSKE
ncbi:MAG: hypothetical protein Q7R35_15980 [Elusimicrobiota bacterium]|nr:hypothetical protein [Elusimicrobiota bacterium]